MKELPMTLAEGATAEEANAFKDALGSARAEVRLIAET